MLKFNVIERVLIEVMKLGREILFFIIPLLFFTNVYAQCDYASQVELSTNAVNIKTKYEIATGQLDPSLYAGCDGEGECDTSYKYYMIYILNLTNNYYVTVTNDVDKTTTTFTSDDANEDGLITFKWEDVSDITTFTFNIYSSEQTNCPNEKQTTKYLTTPRKNYFAALELCDDMKDNYLCEEYVTYEDVTFDEFVKMINNSKEEKQKEEEKSKSLWQQIKEFIVTAKWWVVSGVVLVLVASFVIVTIIRKKREL